MALALCRLKMAAPLHVGERGIGVEATLDYLPSDTLFSALCVTWLEMGQGYAARTTGLAEHFAAQPPLLLTSAFPYVGGLHLLPKPHIRVQPAGGGKEYKRVRWVSPAVFAAMLACTEAQALADLWQNGSALLGDDVWITQNECDALNAHPEVAKNGDDLPRLRREGFWAEMRVPHVAVDRVRNASTLFHVGRVHFAPGSGLWLALRGEQEWISAAIDALTLRGEAGIGGQRSRGHGQYVLEPAHDPALEALLAAPGSSAAPVILLSRAAPTEAQMDRLKHEDAAYGLALVGGYSGPANGAGVIRKQVRLLTEGSVIGGGPDIPGSLVDVTPGKTDKDGNVLPPEKRLVPYDIHRFGFGFAISRQPAAQESTS